MIKRCFNQVKVLLSYEVAKFIMQKHDNPVKQKLASLFAKLNIVRFGRNSLDFLEDVEGKDELF